MCERMQKELACFVFQKYADGLRAGVAQLAEQLICNQQVAGSSPIASSSLMRCKIVVLEGFPSGQRDQTVNLPAKPSEVRILPPPPHIPWRAGCMRE